MLFTRLQSKTSIEDYKHQHTIWYESMKDELTETQYEMLMELCKKWKMEPSEIVGEWCEENYYQVFRMKNLKISN